MKKKENEGVSRRRFLGAAVVGAAVTKTTAADPLPEQEEDAERQRLEALVERCGSELGDLRKVD